MDAITTQPASGYQLRQHEIDGLRQRGLSPIPFDVCAAVHEQDFAPVDALGVSLGVGEAKGVAPRTGALTEAQP